MKNYFYRFIVGFLLVFLSCKQNAASPDIKTPSRVVQDSTPLEKQIIQNNLMDRLHAREELKYFARGIDSSELSEILRKEEGPFTIFALLNSEIDTLTSPKNFQKYLIKEKITTAMMVQRNRKYDGGYKLKTVYGELLTVAKAGDSILLLTKVGDTLLMGQSDILANNGIIHFVSTFKKHSPLE
ncbi:fasciclin domain-containing protein [Jejudonia soesokkakensis]|uniref:Fasciclin domain-containing protein n=1 Tax=Jejudonia soesokkakensis TaxID=1323432 RepID=A0ABW2MXL2_9FLAO